MPISEQEMLRLRDQKKRDWLMLRSDRHFHLIRADASLTEQKYARLLKRYPCGLKEFQELGLHVTPLSREKCTHAIYEGTKKGDHMTLWFSGDVRRYTLGEDCTRERLEAFFDTQQHRWDIPREPDGPDGKTARIIGGILNVLSISLMILSLFGRGFPWGWARWLSLISFVVTVGLCIRWPGRFLADDVRDRRETGRAWSCPSSPCPW